VRNAAQGTASVPQRNLELVSMACPSRIAQPLCGRGAPSAAPLAGIQATGAWFGCLIYGSVAGMLMERKRPVGASLCQARILCNV
jgi:hypothetical protein